MGEGLFLSCLLGFWPRKQHNTGGKGKQLCRPRHLELQITRYPAVSRKRTLVHAYMHFVLTGRILNISFPGTSYSVVCGLSAKPVFLCRKGKVCPSMPFSGFDEGTSSFPPPALQCKLHAGSAFVMVSWHPVCTNRRERKERAFEENPLEQVTGIVRKMQAPVWKPER